MITINSPEGKKKTPGECTYYIFLQRWCWKHLNYLIIFLCHIRGELFYRHLVYKVLFPFSSCLNTTINDRSLRVFYSYHPSDWPSLWMIFSLLLLKPPFFPKPFKQYTLNYLQVTHTKWPHPETLSFQTGN